MSMTRRAAQCAAMSAAALVLATACRTAHPWKEVRTTVCELERTGPTMAGKHVRIKAVFVSDHRHYAALIDQTCPRAALSLSLSGAKDRDKSVDELDEALYSIPADYATNPLKWGVGTRLLLDISGQFQWTAGERLPGRLVVEKMWSWQRLPQAATK